MFRVGLQKNLLKANPKNIQFMILGRNKSDLFVLNILDGKKLFIN